MRCFSLHVSLTFLVAYFCLTLGKDSQLKQYVIDLDSPAKDRWKEVAREYGGVIIEMMDGFSKRLTAQVYEMMTVLAASTVDEIPEEYRDELAGFAECLNVTMGDMLVFNMLYEITAYGGDDDRACTSIVATQPNGKIIHGRNLDYWVTGLNHMAVIVDFHKGGKTVFKGTTFAGYIGLMTGMKPNRFTVSLDERDKGSWMDNDREAAKLGPSGVVAFKIRDLMLDDSSDFEKVVQTLSSTELIAPCYIIVGGIEDNEGAVITHNRTKAIDVWRLDNSAKRWFLVETNYDHWVDPPSQDDRRDPANKMMTSMTQKNLSSDSLFKVLSTAPVMNDGTKYTTIMSASDPDSYESWARNL